MDGKILEKQSIIFQRKNVNSEFLTTNFWAQVDSHLLPVTIQQSMNLEFNQEASIVDFANLSIGGGVLSNGMVQEEIMVLNHPEMLPALLITENLLQNEAIEISGACKMSENQGYSFKTTFKQLFQEEKIGKENIDDFGCKEKHNIIAIDALKFKKDEPYRQFDINNIVRELNKATAGFTNGQ